MYTAETMSIGTSLIYSLLGLTVVFLALISLSVAIIISSKVIRAIEGKAGQTKAAPAAPAKSDEEDKELLAVLASVISEDLGSGPDEIRITSVTELR